MLKFPRQTPGYPERRKHRYIKRFVKALGYRQAALAGGGLREREVIRRARQFRVIHAVRFAE